MTSARKRVIAGVTGTLTDLQALRVAVDSARDRGARRLTRVPADGTV
jgi:hypothetical protein